MPISNSCRARGAAHGASAPAERAQQLLQHEPAGVQMLRVQPARRIAGQMQISVIDEHRPSSLGQHPIAVLIQDAVSHAGHTAITCEGHANARQGLDTVSLSACLMLGQQSVDWSTVNCRSDAPAGAARTARLGSSIRSVAQRRQQRRQRGAAVQPGVLQDAAADVRGNVHRLR